jgi:hypothetical protein
MEQGQRKIQIGTRYAKYDIPKMHARLFSAALFAPDWRRAQLGIGVHGRFARLRPFTPRPAMRVKTFLGSDAEEVDRKVNAWLAKSKVHVRRTTAFKRLRDKGRDALTGRTQARYGVGIAISIWYDAITPQSKSGWSGKSRSKGAS